MTTDQLVDQILQRELHPSERGRPWTEVVARINAADRGGWTKAGITVRTLGEWRHLGRNASRNELDAMTEAECRLIYHAQYVAPFEFIYDPLRALMVDWAVTSGNLRPAKALQEALQERGVYRGQIDGVLGARSKDALLHDPEPRRTYNDVLKTRLAFYQDIALGEAGVKQYVHDHPDSQLRNLAGWTNRVLEFVLT